MKSDSRCPKCQSDAWHVSRGTEARHVFACATCGYLEYFLLDEGARARVIRRWPRVADLSEERVMKLGIENRRAIATLIIALIVAVLGIMIAPFFEHKTNAGYHPTPPAVENVERTGVR